MKFRGNMSRFSDPRGATIATKQSLQETMEHYLSNLREFLSSLYHEKLTIEEGNSLALEAIRIDQSSLLSSLQKWQQQMLYTARQLFPNCKIDDNMIFDHFTSFLRNSVSVEDFELLLLCDQIDSILFEIHGQASQHFNPNDKRIHLFSLQPQINTQKSHVGVMVATEEDELY